MTRIAHARWLFLAAALGLADPPGHLVREGPNAGGELTISGVSLPDGIMARPEQSNPIIQGKNLYAPDLVKNENAWNLYYGGWANPDDGNDRIYAAVANRATPTPPWLGRNIILDRGTYDHVNDPSVVRRAADDWYMAYTVYSDATKHEWIGLVTSRDGMTFTPNVATPECEISVSGERFSSMGRPCLLWTGKVWKLWFDAKIAGGLLHCYLAECTDPFPRRFRLVHSYPDVEKYPGFMEPDVVMINDRYEAVIQRHYTTLVKMVSRDGVHFDEAGVILTASDPGLGKKRIENPGWIGSGTGGVPLGVAFGMTDDINLTANAVGFAYHQLAVQVSSPPNITHLYGHARGPDVFVPLTFGHRDFTRIRVEDPKSHATVADQPVSSRPGDHWRLVVGGDPAGR